MRGEVARQAEGLEQQETEARYIEKALQKAEAARKREEERRRIQG